MEALPRDILPLSQSCFYLSCRTSHKPVLRAPKPEKLNPRDQILDRFASRREMTEREFGAFLAPYGRPRLPTSRRPTDHVSDIKVRTKRRVSIARVHAINPIARDARSLVLDPIIPVHVVSLPFGLRRPIDSVMHYRRGLGQEKRSRGAIFFFAPLGNPGLLRLNPLFFRQFQSHHLDRLPSIRPLTRISYRNQ